MFFLSLPAFTLTASSQDGGASAASSVTTPTFNDLYPDLKPHTDVVNAALKALIAEGFVAPTMSASMDAVASRARSNLQLSKQDSTSLSEIDRETFAKRQNVALQEAKRLFPEVSCPGSVLDKRVRREREKLSRIYPDYFKNPEWPLMLTNGCIAAMMLERQETGASTSEQTQQQSEASQLNDSMLDQPVRPVPFHLEFKNRGKEALYQQLKSQNPNASETDLRNAVDGEVTAPRLDSRQDWTNRQIQGKQQEIQRRQQEQDSKLRELQTQQEQMGAPPQY